MLPGLANLTKAESVILAALAAGIAAYPVLPFLTWILAFVYLAGYLVVRIRELRAEDRRWLLICTAGAAGAQLIVFLFNRSYDPTGLTAWLDDQIYFSHSATIANVWREGVFPELTRKGTPPYLGTLHTGYERMLASLFYVTGQSVRAGLALNLVSTALLPALIYLLADSLFRDLPTTGFPPARAATLVLVFNPAVYYWASMMLKDHVLATLFIATLLLLVETIRTRRPIHAAGFLLLLFWTAILRNYAALSLIAAAAAYPFTRLHFKALFWAAVYGSIGVILLSYTDTGYRYIGQLLNSLFAIVPSELNSVKSTLIHFGAAVPRMVFGPYAWVRVDDSRALYELYPATWYLYLVVYPLALAGFIHAVAANHRKSILPATAVLASAFVLMVAYGGNASRQRFYLELIAVVYAGLGARPRFQLLGFALVWGALLLFAAVRLLSRLPGY